jgi:hypothetical protein
VGYGDLKMVERGRGELTGGQVEGMLLPIPGDGQDVVGRLLCDRGCVQAVEAISKERSRGSWLRMKSPLVEAD